MIALAILSCWFRIYIFPGFCLGTVLKLVLKLSQLSSTPYCLLYTPTLLLCLSVCTCSSLCLSSIHRLWKEMDYTSVRRLWLQMSGKNLGSRIGLSTLAGSNFGQTTVCGFTVWRKNVGL